MEIVQEQLKKTLVAKWYSKKVIPAYLLFLLKVHSNSLKTMPGFCLALFLYKLFYKLKTHKNENRYY